MSYLYAAVEPMPGPLGCGPGCGCARCRSERRGTGCDCRGGAATLAGLGERYVTDDEEEDDRPPRARTPLPPTRMRSGLGGPGLEGFGAAPAPRVVLVPGIMGSRLVERHTGVPVWGDNRMLLALASPATVATWRLAMGSGNGINHGGVLQPAGLTRLAHVDPYTRIMADLRGAIGSANVLAFAYDWRLSNEHNAALLRAAILARFPDASSAPDRRVCIIAHSMGGLVARFLIEQLGGSTLVRRLLTVGTPHLGAPEALVTLATVGSSTLVAPFLGPVAAVAARALLTLVRNYGSLVQLLPGFDHLVPRGAAAPETITATFRRLRTDPFWNPVLGRPGAGGSILRGPASLSIRNLNRRLTAALPSLNATLAAANVEYFTLAGFTHPTTLQAREVAGPIVSAVKTRCGDGTVPAHSAVLPGGTNVHRLFTASGQLHGDLFNDPAIRALCLDVARGAAVTSPVPPPGCATPAPRGGLEGGLGCAAHAPTPARAATVPS